MGFKEKVRAGQFEKLTEKEIDEFIDENWLLWTCRFDLSPCGHLTRKGKQRYIEGYVEEIKKLFLEQEGKRK